MLICNIGDGLLDYAKVIAYLATHSQTNYLPISTKLMTFSNSSTSRTNIFISSAMLDCSITSLCHVTKSTCATFFVLQENLERSCGRRRCIKECSTAVGQATGVLLNASRLR